MDRRWPRIQFDKVRLFRVMISPSFLDSLLKSHISHFFMLALSKASLNGNIWCLKQRIGLLLVVFILVQITTSN